MDLNDIKDKNSAQIGNGSEEIVFNTSNIFSHLEPNQRRRQKSQQWSVNIPLASFRAKSPKNRISTCPNHDVPAYVMDRKEKPWNRPFYAVSVVN